MQKFEIVIPTLFGLEAVCAREVRSLGYETKAVDNGRITLEGDFSAVARLNINLRTAERVLIKIGAFRATSFDELFEKSRALPWDGVDSQGLRLSREGPCVKIKAAFRAGHPVHFEKSIVEKLKQGARRRVAFGNRREISNSVFPFKRFLHPDAGHLRRAPLQTGATARRQIWRRCAKPLLRPWCS